MLVATLHVRPPLAPGERNHYYYYDVAWRGKLVVRHTLDPEHDLARYLKSQGVTGIVELREAITGKARVRIDIAKAVRFTALDSHRRLERVRYRPLKSFPGMCGGRVGG